MAAAEEAPTPEVASLPTAELARAVQTLSWNGSTPEGADPGCVERALENLDLSPAAQQALVMEADGEHGSLARTVTTLAEGTPGLSALAGPTFRGALVRCQIDALHLDGEVDLESYTPPSTNALEPVEPRPNLVQTVDLEIRPHDTDQQIAARIGPGLVTLFSSFSSSDAEKEVFEEASSCFATTVGSAGFSRQSILTLGGGPKMGAGSVADILATSEDRDRWASQTFRLQLRSCISQAEQTIAERAAEEAEATQE